MRGFLTFAQNNGETDYLTLAYLQALSIKTSCQTNSYAVVVDSNTMKLVTDKHRSVFDYVILVPGNDDAADAKWKMQNEWKAQLASPFDETIKLEADMIVPTSLDHWWDILSSKDIVFTNKVANYIEQTALSRTYRKVFDANNLPDIYAGLYYFKNTTAVSDFFQQAKVIFENWQYTRTQILKDAELEPPSTDLVFALAARLYGEERCVMPGNVPVFTHMKGAIQNWPSDAVWTNYLHHQLDGKQLTVGFHRQRLPFHYHFKNFPTPEIIEHYERLYQANIHSI